jgi:uncharacterized membrane protein
MISKDLLILLFSLLVLDIIWIKFYMSDKYQELFNKILKEDIKLQIIPAIVTYSIMIFALYYFVLRESKSEYDALLRGSLLGFIMYGVYDGTLYSFMPMNEYKTGIIDVLWGTFICGFTSYIAFKFK